MGVIADGLAAYAKPLLDKHSSSLEQLQYAMMLAQICWNIAVTPEEKHESRILELQKTFQLSDTEFLEFRKDIVEPMIQRHKDMFPKMRPGQLLCTPLHAGPKPTCAYFVKEVSRQSELVDYTKCW